MSEGGDVYSTEEQNEVKESEKAELWDLEKEKMDYYGLEVYLGGLSDTPAIYRKGVPFTSQVGSKPFLVLFESSSLMLLKKVLINCQGVLLPYVFHNTQEAIELASFHEWKNMRIPKEECQAHPLKKQKREEKPSDGDPVCKLSSRLEEDGGAAFHDLLRDWHQFRFDGQKSFLSSVVKWQEMGILFHSCSLFLLDIPRNENVCLLVIIVTLMHKTRLARQSRRGWKVVLPKSLSRKRWLKLRTRKCLH